jgi:hypothetical protein
VGDARSAAKTAVIAAEGIMPRCRRSVATVEAEVVAELVKDINASLDLDTVIRRVVEGAKDHLFVCPRSHRGRPLSPLATAHHLRIGFASITIFQGRVCMCRIGLLLQLTGVRPMPSLPRPRSVVIAWAMLPVQPQEACREDRHDGWRDDAQLVDPAGS